MKDARRWLRPVAFALALGLVSLGGTLAPSVAAGEDLFVETVAPILKRRCLSCHNASEAKGDLALHTSAGLLENGYVVPGDPQASYLLEAVTSQDGKRPAMPKKGEPLTKQEVAAIRKWIAAGANWPNGLELTTRVLDTDWWSLHPIERVTVPPLDDAGRRWCRTPIDAFIWHKLREKELSPSPPADRRTLIRRLYFDLIGLPPTYDEIESFVNDPSPGAYDSLVDRLLASPRYGERWARHWLDVVHYGDTHGFDKDKLRTNAWPYRDYVVRSFNEDKTYSQFVEEQLAGDVLYPDTPDGIVATGFIAAGSFDWVGQIEVRRGTMEKKRVRNLDRDDMVTTAINTFVSTTVQCARCHNHKFDPVTMEDYYGLQAVFAGVDRSDRPYNLEPKVQQQRYELTKRQSELVEQRERLDQAVARSVAEPLAEVDRQIAALETQRKSAAKRPEYGYHSAIEPSPDKPKWVQVDLGKRVTLRKVILVGCHDTFAGIGAGFGFPVRFKVELSDDPTFRSKSHVLADHASEDYPNPGLVPVELDADGHTGRYLRVTATKLVRRLPNDYIFALAELQTLDEAGANVARGKPVNALDKAGSPPRWAPENLTDGIFYSGGLTENESADLSKLQEDRRTLLQQGATTEQQQLREQLAEELAKVESALQALPSGDALVFAAATHFSPSGNFVPTEGVPREIYLLRRGNPADPDKSRGPVAPRSLGVFSDLQHHFDLPAGHSEGARRAALAHWITDERNPLTWRSIVNRIWQYHFGRGIVDTPNDFGRMGSQPTHPKLLDWLAAEFRDGGGPIRKQSIKSLHRLIVTSSVYRQCVAGDAAKAKIDGANEFLWRMNRHKLEAEPLRDAVLQAAGKLDLRMYGPGFRAFEIEKPQHSPHYLYDEHDADDPESWRRTVYRFIVRSVPDPFMAALDCADPSQIVEKRVQTMTAVQALSLLNDKFIVRMSEHMADRVNAAAEDPEEKIRLAFRLALGRNPLSNEVDLLRPIVEKHGMANVCRILINSNEFVFVD